MEIDIVEIFKYIWSIRKKITLWATIGLIVGIIIGFSLPKQYEASIILVNENNKKELSGSSSALVSIMGMDNISNQSGVNETLYPAIIRSSPFLLEFANMQITTTKGESYILHEYISKYQKRPWWNIIIAAPSKLISLLSATDTSKFESSLPMQKAFYDALRNKISLEVNSKDKITQLKTKFQDPNIALIVVDSVFVKLERYMNDYTTQKIRKTIQSNQLMLNQAQKKYFDADSKYAETVDRNLNTISKVAQIKLDRLNNERDLAYQIYNQLATQVETDKIKLQEQTYIATIIEPARLPLLPSSPNKKLIAFATTLLATLLAVGYFFIAFFKKKSK